MWILTVRSPDSTPFEYKLIPDLNTVGRRKDNDVVVSDEAASRIHAEIHLNAETQSVTIKDIGSKNGTFINRHKIAPHVEQILNTNDTIRIGSFEMLLNAQGQENVNQAPDEGGVHAFNRDLLIESFDNHAVLLYEVIQKLNGVLDIDLLLEEVSLLLQKTLGADKCQVILARDFDRIKDLGFPTKIAKHAIEKQATVLLPVQGPDNQKLLSDSAQILKVQTLICTPVIQGDRTIALVYLYKTHADSRLFNQRDLQLAVAVGHLTGLSIERVGLMERVQEEHRIRQFLQRFVAPTEAEFLLKNYLELGRLPELREMQSTVLFADMANSSSMAEKLGPKRFGELLNRYYQDVTNIIFEYGGLIDKYLGDGFMAVFGMNQDDGKPEESAVSAGIEILELIESRYSGAPDKIDIGIGINSGSIVAGYVSTKERLELSVLGDTVNVAARLESLARPNRIVIGPQTREALNGSFNLSDLGEQVLKGRSKPLKVFEVHPQ